MSGHDEVREQRSNFAKILSKNKDYQLQLEQTQVSERLKEVQRMLASIDQTIFSQVLLLQNKQTLPTEESAEMVEIVHARPDGLYTRRSVQPSLEVKIETAKDIFINSESKEYQIYRDRMLKLQ